MSPGKRVDLSETESNPDPCDLHGDGNDGDLPEPERPAAERQSHYFSKADQAPALLLSADRNLKRKQPLTATQRAAKASKRKLRKAARKAATTD